MTHLHLSAERQRAHRMGQQKIVHYCSCGMAPRGNAAWWSHRHANPDHESVTVTEFALRAEKKREAGQ